MMKIIIIFIIFSIYLINGQKISFSDAKLASGNKFVPNNLLTFKIMATSSDLWIKNSLAKSLSLTLGFENAKLPILQNIPKGKLVKCADCLKEKETLIRYETDDGNSGSKTIFINGFGGFGSIVIGTYQTEFDSGNNDLVLAANTLSYSCSFTVQTIAGGNVGGPYTSPKAISTLTSDGRKQCMIPTKLDKKSFVGQKYYLEKIHRFDQSGNTLDLSSKDEGGHYFDLAEYWSVAKPGDFRGQLFVSPGNYVSVTGLFSLKKAYFCRFEYQAHTLDTEFTATTNEKGIECYIGQAFQDRVNFDMDMELQGIFDGKSVKVANTTSTHIIKYHGYVPAQPFSEGPTKGGTKAILTIAILGFLLMIAFVFWVFHTKVPDRTGRPDSKTIESNNEEIKQDGGYGAI